MGMTMREWADDAVLLTPDEMGRADRLTIEAGTASLELMRRAGLAVADTVLRQTPTPERIAILAGPGNNGGDAYVAAAELAARGFAVTVFALEDPCKRVGDAALAAKDYDAAVLALARFEPDRFDLVVDGLFGAGLSRNVIGEAETAICRLSNTRVAVVAIDLPSGISGATGALCGAAVRADVTVTFFRRKPGHLLQPGRAHCGRVVVCDIGIDTSVLAAIKPACFANEPGLWAKSLKRPSADGHKFDRGHAVVLSGGPMQSGAGRLSAMAALRGGAGLVTVASPGSALMVNASHMTAVMLKRCNDGPDLARLLDDRRLNAFVLGPGFGVQLKARDFTGAILDAGRRLVLDADGLTAFKAQPASLFAPAAEAAAARGEPALILTPHAGEFLRLFPDLADDASLSKLDRARAAAARAHAVVILKGSDTVIAAPDGRAAINAVGTPWLATAGSGDVLSGIAAAQLAQGMASFEAACVAVWIHGRAAELFGAGLISEDLPGLMPRVLEELTAMAAAGVSSNKA